MKKRLFFIALLTITVSFILSGCLVPEKFKADAVINKDKNYTLSYKGTMIAAQTRAMFHGLTASDMDLVTNEMQKELLTKHGDVFKTVKHVGNFIFEIDYLASGKLEKTYNFPYRSINDEFFGKDSKLLSFTVGENETIIVKSGVTDKDWDELKKTGIEVKGILTLKTDAKVLEHNAPKTPGFFSSTYEWEIGPGKPLPHMILKSGDSGQP